MATSTISVIMPNYNDSEFISIALKAICEQSYPPLEVIVVDDASTDNSVEIIQALMAKYPMIRLIRSEVNSGAVAASNRAAELASGDLLAMCSANDEILPGLFEKSVELLEKYPQAGLCCADMYFLNVSDGSTSRNPPNWLPSPGYLSPADLAEATRISKIPHPLTYTAIVRRSALPEGPLFRPDMEWFGDWFLVQPIAFRHGCCYIPEPLANFRWLGRGYAYSGVQNRKLYKEIYKIVISLLASSEYEDIAPLMIRGRSLQFMELFARNPIITWQAIKSVKNPNSQAMPLFLYITKEYFQDSIKTSAQLWQKNIIETFENVSRQTKGLLKNTADRIYAKLFHEYDRARSFIRKKMQPDQ